MSGSKAEKELYNVIYDALRKAGTNQDAVVRITEIAAGSRTEENIIISKGTIEGYYIQYTENHGNHDLVATIRIHHYPSLIESFKALAEVFIK
jgi:hypothetical protein